MPRHCCKLTFLILSLLSMMLFAGSTQAAFGNYNSILVGERAAGMGGAFTSLTGDPSACSYYNPASLARMLGRSLSASVSAYHKYDSEYGTNNEFSEAALRVNRGSFKPIPSASGSASGLGRFAFAMSILVPEHDFYSGEIAAENNSISYLNQVDESLWVGGTLALNLSRSDAVGLTIYYTARNLIRTISDETLNPTDAFTYKEEKNLANNSLVYILGYYRKLNDNWAIGMSHRFASLEVSGFASYYISQLQTNPYSKNSESSRKVDSETRIPPRTAIGISYQHGQKWTISADLVHYGAEQYRDIEHPLVGDLITHKDIVNLAVGFEYQLRSWLKMRNGLYTNFSSHPNINESLNERQPDHVDMWGFSTNFAIFTTPSTSYTFGGYYSGGNGRSIQRIQQQFRTIPKSSQTFAMLVGSAYYF